MTMWLDDDPTGIAAEPTGTAGPATKGLRVNANEPAVVGDVVHVVVRLTDGDQVLAGTFPDAQQAHELAKELQNGFGKSDTVWPLVEGRYLRPQAVVSIDLVEEEHRRWGGSADRAKVKGFPSQDA
jgi:hypothetical protein